MTSVSETGFNRYTVELDKQLGEADGFYFTNASAVPSTVVKNCIYKNYFARGVLIKCKKALIENCCFENIADSAVKIAPQSSWKDGGASEDVTVKDCKVINCKWLEKLCGGIFAYNEAQERGINVHKSITVETAPLKICQPKTS